MGKLVFDIGANFGQSTQRYLEAGLQVVAVEPNPEAAESIRQRLREHIEAGGLVVEECAVWAEQTGGGETDESRVSLFVNSEDSEWSSVFESCGRRFNTEAREVLVKATTLPALYKRHGQPFYIKIDTEGSDGVCLHQLKELSPPPYLSFELNSLRWLTDAAALGYNAFKVVAQGCHEAQELLDVHGRPLTHAGAFGEAAMGEAAGGGWRTLQEAEEDIRRLCIVHDEAASVGEFAAAPPRYVERDFATLRACFPLESRDDEEWYDVHCRHSTVRAPLCSAELHEKRRGQRDRSRSPSGVADNGKTGTSFARATQ